LDQTRQDDRYEKDLERAEAIDLRRDDRRQARRGPADTRL
jgi:hypothetical protein